MTDPTDPLEAVIEWLLHPPKSYTPHQLAMETVARLRAATPRPAGDLAGIEKFRESDIFQRAKAAVSEDVAYVDDGDTYGQLVIGGQDATPRPAELPRCEHGAIREPCVPCSDATPRPAGVDVERLARAIYLRCGDRSTATAREDAAAILKWLATDAALTGSEEPLDTRD